MTPETHSVDRWIELLEARNEVLVETVAVLQARVKKLHSDLIDEYRTPGKDVITAGLHYYDKVDLMYHTHVELIDRLRAEIKDLE